jgi:hypothetical protein
VGICGLDIFESGWGELMGPCKHGNEHLGSVRGGEFLD